MKNFKNSVKYYLLERRTLSDEEKEERKQQTKQREKEISQQDEALKKIGDRGFQKRLPLVEKGMIRLKLEFEKTQKKLEKVQEELEALKNRREEIDIAFKNRLKSTGAAIKKQMLEILERVEAAKIPERAPGSPRTATVRMNPEEWDAEDGTTLKFWRERAEHYLDKKGDNPDVWQNIWDALVIRTRGAVGSANVNNPNTPERMFNNIKWFITYWSKVIKNIKKEHLGPIAFTIKGTNRSDKAASRFLNIYLKMNHTVKKKNLFLSDEQKNELVELLKTSWSV